MPIRLTNIPRTCGCLALGTEGGLHLPATLQPGERYPFKVELSTDGKVGAQSAELIAQGATLEGAAVANAVLPVRGKIRSSILPLPEDIDLELTRQEAVQTLVCMVELADAWPGTGLELARIETTGGGRLRVASTPAEGRVIVRGLDLTRRALLTIRYDVPPGVRSFDETITLTPRDESARPSTVRLHGKVLPAYEFVPETLVILRPDPATAPSRIFEYRYRGDQFRKLQPVDLAPELRLERLRDALGATWFRLTHLAGAGASPSRYDLMFRVGEGEETITLPVTLTPPMP